MRNDWALETDVRDGVLRALRELVPGSWQLEWRESTGRRLDAVLVLAGPGQERVSFGVELKRAGRLPAAALVTALRDQARRTELPLLFVSDYIGPALRQALEAEGISFADATGWVRISLERPLVVLAGEGAPRSPRSAGRATAVTRLDGIAASRTVRALAEAQTPVGVRALAARAEVSPGSVSKLLVTLGAEGIVDRDENGAVALVRRRALIRRWVADYSFGKTNSAIRYGIAPRGIRTALRRVGADGDARWPQGNEPGAVAAGVALTGSAAARALLPDSLTSVVPLRNLAIYATEPAAVMDDLGLIDADAATANVVLARPQDPDILRIPSPDGRAPLAPLALILADLFTLPGRSDAEAEQLMDMLATTDPTWRE